MMKKNYILYKQNKHEIIMWIFLFLYHFIPILGIFIDDLLYKYSYILGSYIIGSIIFLKILNWFIKNNEIKN